MSQETNVLAIEMEGAKEQSMGTSSDESYGNFALNFIVKSGFLLGASLCETRGDSEVLLIEGSLRVSF